MHMEETSGLLISENIDYRRGYDHNYMVIKGWNDTGTYIMRMLGENRIQGLLTMKMTLNEGKEELCYDISSRQPLSRVFEHREINYEKLVKIIKETERSYSAISEYMLPEEHMILNPEYIYMNVETCELAFAYYEGYTRSFGESYLELAEYLMERVNHSDTKAVMLAYRLFRTVKDNNFTLEAIMNMLTDENDKDMDDSYSREDSRVPEISSYEELRENHDEENNVIGDTRSIGIIAGRLKEKALKLMKRESGIREDEAFPTEKAACKPMGSVSGAHNIPEEAGYGKTVILVNNTGDGQHYLVRSVKGREETYELGENGVTIGKLEDSVDIVLNDNSVSRMHARIYKEGDCWYIMDTNSTNGTYVNGLQLEGDERIILESGDELRFGRVKMEFR